MMETEGQISRVCGQVAELSSEILGAMADMRTMLQTPRMEKQWFSTTELAELLEVSQYTVQERWCNQGRIECRKDPNTGKWRIPAHEVRRLQAAGAPKPKAANPRNVAHVPRAEAAGEATRGTGAEIQGES